MKKTKITRFLAALLVMLQLTALLAIGVNAANVEATVYYVDPALMELDGEKGLNEPWGELETQKQAFMHANANSATDSIRVAWGSDENGTYVYYYVVYSDMDDRYTALAEDKGYMFDGFIFGVDEKGAFEIPTSESVGSSDVNVHRCGTQKAEEGKRTSGPWLEYCVKRDGSLITIEARTKFISDANIKAGSVVGLNVMVQKCDGATYKQIMWSGSNPSAGTVNYVRCTLSEKFAADVNVNYNENDNAIFYNATGKAIMSKNAESGSIILPASISGLSVAGWKNRADNKLYAASSAVPYSGTQLKFDAIVAVPLMKQGASVFIEQPSKLGFTFSVNGFSVSQSYITKMGVLVCEATLITDGMAEGGLTKEKLVANGITPEDIVAPTVAESFRAEVSVAQNDTQYAALGYVTVKYSDNTEKTFYTDFSNVRNVRSVQEVAAAAYNDRVGIKMDYYTFKQGAAYGILDFEKFSYSPYANTQLKTLKVLGGIA